LIISNVQSEDVAFFAIAGTGYLPALIAEIMRNLLVRVVTGLLPFVMAPSLIGLTKLGEA
jgi:hypothetical protein